VAIYWGNILFQFGKIGIKIRRNILFQSSQIGIKRNILFQFGKIGIKIFLPILIFIICFLFFFAEL